ncbi:hypothetical protein, partial [Modestobacter versicolor]|uniref:hypothetical protein n=1 Tax=Modestobacter versicolor TaxID=429133 RepID=UPI0034DE33A7
MHNKDVMLSEYLVDNNLWQAIIATGSLPFLAALSADELNALTSIKYGQRKMFKPYLVPTVDIIAKMLVAEYLEQWGKYNDFLKGISNIAASTGHKITESISDQGNELTTGEIVTKVTAFNSDTFIDDKAVDNHNNVDTVNDRFRT